LTAHIFTVNPDTFNVHLNYMFAGTGKDNEKHNKGALADILAVRPGDDIVFYVIERGFYGFFKAENHPIFYEGLAEHYLQRELGRTLTYRLFIEPSSDGVFRSGVKEWDAIENPVFIQENKIYNMQWSWIFKKLKGNRGCTAITNDEFRLLRQIIAKEEDRLPQSQAFSFSGEHILPLNRKLSYTGNTTEAPRNSEDIKRIRLEVDLRICFTALSGHDIVFNPILQPERYGNIISIANEVICSFGEKKIDLMMCTDRQKCLLIELKNSFECDDSVPHQIASYARWVSAYKPELQEIIPILIVKAPKPYPARGGCKKFKCLSLHAFEQSITSPWYNSILAKITEARQIVRDYQLARTSALRVYQFSTAEKNILTGFAEIR